jgi:hypothetical protein
MRGALRLADVDGDGRVDIALLQTDHIDIYYGRGGDRFSQPVSVAFSWPDAGYLPNTVTGFELVDLDRDNLPDLVVVFNQYYSYTPFTLGVMINEGDAGFAPMVEYPGGSLYARLNALAVADINRDQFPDLVIADDTTVYLVLNVGDGGLGSPTPIFDGGATTLLAGDFNGDGQIDVVAFDSARGQLAFLYNNGTGGFVSPPPWVFAPLAFSHLLLAADLNGDGLADLVATNGDLLVLLAEADGGFATSNYPSPPLTAMVSADLNQDGHPDLVATSDLILFINRGDGRFLSYSSIDAGVSPSLDAVTGPFGDDPTPDLALLSAPGADGLGLTIYRNGCR